MRLTIQTSWDGLKKAKILLIRLQREAERVPSCCIGYVKLWFDTYLTTNHLNGTVSSKLDATKSLWKYWKYLDDWVECPLRLPNAGDWSIWAAKLLSFQYALRPSCLNMNISSSWNLSAMYNWRIVDYKVLCLLSRYLAENPYDEDWMIVMDISTQKIYNNA